MEYLATFLEGVVTFISPCLLPMLPAYLAFFAGGSSEAIGAGMGGPASLRRTFANACGFCLGFTVVFVLLGALAGSLGRLVAEHAAILNIVCGIVVIVLGLFVAGWVRIPILDRSVRLQADVRPAGFASSVVFGIVFSIGWTPCVGAFLGSALMLAAMQASATKGIVLLLLYSLGLAIPFIVCALAVDRLAGAFAAIKRHYAAVNRICGILLIAMGIAMATGLMSEWLVMLGELGG